MRMRTPNWETVWGVEQLEPRLLLSDFIVVGPSGELMQAHLGDPAMINISNAPQPPSPGSPERTRLRAYDAGDSYRYFERDIPLHRVFGMVGVGFTASASPEEALASVIGPDGILSGWSVHAELGREGVVLTSDSGPGAKDALALLEKLARCAGVAWAGPVFLNMEAKLLQVVGNEVIVKLEEGRTLDDVLPPTTPEPRRLGGTTDTFVIRLEVGGADALNAARAYAGLPGVVWAEPNFYGEVVQAAIDPLYPEQWHLDNVGQTGAAFFGADVDAPEAWLDTPPSTDIVIAVLDNGVQTTHPDLNVWTNPGEVPGDMIDNDGNGWIDDLNGWDFLDWDPDPSPSDPADNHGTAVAGVAAAIGGNGLGGKGVSYGARVMPLKMIEGAFWASNANRAEAIRYAAGFCGGGQGTWRSADVLNISAFWPESQVVTDALAAAADCGRGGFGLPIFAASANNASGYRVVTTPEVTGAWPGSWCWLISYRKDGSDSGGEDTAWLGELTNSDGTVYNFYHPAVEWDGWNLNPVQGQPGWLVEDDPAYAYGTGRYQLRASHISANQEAFLMGPPFFPTGGVIPPARMWLWQSSEPQDVVVLRLYYCFNGTYFELETIPGQDPATTPMVAYPAWLGSTIAVGATTDWGYRADYSQYGANLDFVAPSDGGFGAILTTDRTGDDGYNRDGGDDGDPLEDTNYTSRFGGTSAASPLAAGIAALLLSKKPDLTADQIRQIMRESGDEIGSVQYVNGFNQYYGYGRVNAAGALAMVSRMPTGVVLRPESDTGMSSSDGITSLDNSGPGKTLTFDVLGTVEGALVALYADGTPIATGTAPQGNVTTVVTCGESDLIDGLHSITARQTEPGRLESAPSAGLALTVDTIAPNVPGAPDLLAASDTGLSDADDITSDDTPTFGLSGAAPYFRFYRDGGLVSGLYETGAEYTLPAQADGQYTWTVTAVDAAGNESAASAPLNVLIDTAAPSAVSFQRNEGPDCPSLIDSISISFSENVGASLQVTDLEVYKYVGEAWTGVDISDASVSWNAGSLTAKWDFSAVSFPEFPSGTGEYAGWYCMVLRAPGVTDAAGNVLDGDYATGVLMVAICADTDLDGDVDFIDYLTVKGNFGTLEGATWAMGDSDYDGDVDYIDYLTAKANFGQTIGSAPSLPPP